MSDSAPETKLDGDVQAAVETLLRRMAHETRAAARAGIGSNSHGKRVARARFLRWAAGQIVADGKLQDRLRTRDLLTVGWRTLAGELAAVYRKHEADASKAKATP